MKTLYIVRHAKADRSFENIIDFDRPLTERGIHNAHLIAELLAKKKDTPDVIISSPAIRALSTALIFLRKFDLSYEKLFLEEDIYEASEKDLTKIIQNTADEHNNIMIFGHNPGFTDICNYYIKPHIENLPTSGVVKIEFNISSWKEATGHKGNLIYLESPKQIQKEN